jgi:4-amino-4-deoxy-L-arabinose transferase-like glycosyltransferase
MRHLLSIRPLPKGVQIILLIGICFILYFVNLGRWDLWSPDEPRYAEVAREMVVGGDWILMHYNGSVYSDKPPLFFWFIAFSSYLWQGFSSFSVRFSSAFFGTLTVLLTFFLGKHLYSSRTGFLSGLILATAFEFSYLSTRANIDATLTFFTTLSLLCFILWYQHWKSENRDEKPNRGYFIYGFYVAMALATLTKGPVGFILPLLVSLVYLTLQKDWKGMRRMKLLPGMLLFLAFVLAWYVPAVLKGGREYLDETLLRHSIGRFAKGTIHIRPIYYYLYTFPVGFLPWTLFLPAAIYDGVSRESMEERKQFLFLGVWVMVIFLFFSLTKGKRDLYLLPLFPGGSLMVGKLWNDFTSSSKRTFRHEWISFPLYGFMGFMLLAGVAIPWVVSAKFPPFVTSSFPIAFLLVGGGLGMLVLLRIKYRRVIFFLLVGIVGAGFFYTVRVVFPLINPYKSARFICQETVSRIQPGEKLATYRFETAPYNYYTKIVPILELGTEKALSEFLKSSERVFCLVRGRDLDRIRMKEDLRMVELAGRNHTGYRDIILISNR